MPRFLLLFLPALGLLLSAASAARPAPAPSPYAALAALETRVASIGFRLTTANVAWCTTHQAQFGWILGDLRLYGPGQRAAARDAYGATDGDMAFVAALAPASPAAAAGLHPGSALPASDDIAPAANDGGDPFARIAALEMRFAALPPGVPASISGTPGVTPVPGCVSDFRVEARDRPTGAADGRLVLISAGLAQFATNDDELAAAVAHELAHNILRHRARLDAAGVRRGLLKQVGRNARLFRQTEVEADRLSPWLLAGAGYAPQAAVRFWQRFGQREGRPLFQAGTHPRWQDRVTAIEAEVRVIEQARREGRPLVPPTMSSAAPLE